MGFYCFDFPIFLSYSFANSFLAFLLPFYLACCGFDCGSGNNVSSGIFCFYFAVMFAVLGNFELVGTSVVWIKG